MSNHPRETPAPTPTRAAVELALMKMEDCYDRRGNSDAPYRTGEYEDARAALLALFDAPPRPVNFCSTCGKDVRGLRDVDGIHTCHNPRDAR